MQIRYERHARNHMRHWKISQEDIERIINTYDWIHQSGHRFRVFGYIGARRFRVVVARDSETEIAVIAAFPDEP